MGSLLDDGHGTEVFLALAAAEALAGFESTAWLRARSSRAGSDDHQRAVLLTERLVQLRVLLAGQRIPVFWTDWGDASERRRSTFGLSYAWRHYEAEQDRERDAQESRTLCCARRAARRSARSSGCVGPTPACRRRLAATTRLFLRARRGSSASGRLALRLASSRWRRKKSPASVRRPSLANEMFTGTSGDARQHESDQSAALQAHREGELGAEGPRQRPHARRSGASTAPPA